MSIRAFDPLVHAALVALFAALLKLGWRLVFQTELPDEFAVQVAGAIVIYLLSLFGYGLWLRATFSRRTAVTDGPSPYEYSPFLMR